MGMAYRVNMFNKFNITKDEQDFIKNVDASGGMSMDSYQVHSILANFYLEKHIESSTERIIESNTKLEGSNNRHSRIMIWLTLVIAILTLVMVVKMFL